MAQEQQLATPQIGWKQLGATILKANFSGAMDLTAAASITPTAGIFWELGDATKFSGLNAAQVAFVATGADNTVFDFELWGYFGDSDINSPVLIWDSGDAQAAVVGTQYVDGTEHWVDTIGGTAGPFTNATVLDSGNNRIAVIEFDCKGMESVQCNLIDATATVTSVRPMLRGY